MSHPLSKYEPGHRVRVTQQVPRQRGPMYATVEGTVVRFGQQKTGSWYAHAKDDKLWLDRLELRKDDGELVVLNLDQFSSIERVKVALPNGVLPPAKPVVPLKPVLGKPVPAKPVLSKPAPAKPIPAKTPPKTVASRRR